MEQYFWFIQKKKLKTTVIKITEVCVCLNLQSNAETDKVGI